MNAVLIDRSLGYPDSFYRRLNDFNSEKLPFAPVALVLKASTREASLADLPRILQMAKTHRVVLQELGQTRSFGKNIQDALEKTGVHPKKLVCLAHGIGSSKIEIGRDLIIDGEQEARKSHFYSIQDVKEEDFINLDEDAQIFLSGCSTGSGEKSLAKRIAVVSKRTVYAPSELLQRPYTCFLEYPDGKWKMLSYLHGGKQHVYKFMPDGSFKLSSKKTFGQALQRQGEIRSCFASYARSMEKFALMGNAQTRKEMSDFCRMAIPGCFEEDAVHWLLSAAIELNDAKAQYELGCWNLEGCSWGNVEKSPENALFWFQLAADQGYCLAQFNTGLCFLNGNGCEKSESRAVEYFRLAADQGDPDALTIMGQYSELGIGGLPLSKQSALFYFALAAKRGSELAQTEYRRLHLELELDEFEQILKEEKFEELESALDGFYQKLEELQLSERAPCS